jgi:hypothetical protein
MTLRTGSGGELPSGGSLSPVMCLHLTVVLGFSILEKGEAKISTMYITLPFNFNSC